MSCVGDECEWPTDCDIMHQLQHWCGVAKEALHSHHCQGQHSSTSECTRLAQLVSSTYPGIDSRNTCEILKLLSSCDESHTLYNNFARTIPPFLHACHSFGLHDNIVCGYQSPRWEAALLRQNLAAASQVTDNIKQVLQSINSPP